MERARTVELLLQHRKWMLCIARDLTRDDAAAEDLVQDTFVAALRTPPREPKAIRGWLRRVLSRRGHEERRRDQARELRERRDPTATTAPDAHQLVERAEVQQRVVAAVMDLPEPYRQTLLMRFFEDQTPREIARRTGVPVETVRTRVRRGLDRVRRSLDRDDDGRRSWRAVLLTWADASDPRPLWPTPTAAVSAGAAMATAAKVCGAVAVVLLAAWWAWSPTSDDGAVLPAPASADVEVATSTERAVPRSRIATEPEEDTTGTAESVHETSEREADIETPRPPDRVRGRVTSSGTPIPDAALRIDVYGDDGETVEGTTDADGQFELALPLVGERRRLPTDVRISVSTPEHVPLDRLTGVPALVPGGAVTLDLTLERAHLRRGRVLGADGLPLAQAHVAFVRRLGESAPEVVDRTRTDALGRYVLRCPPGTTGHVVAIAEGHGPLHRPTADDTEGPEPDLALPAAAKLQVRVRVPDHIPVEDVVVTTRGSIRYRHEFEVGGKRMGLDEGRLVLAETGLRHVGDGVWEADGLPSVATSVRVYPRGAVYDLKSRQSRTVRPPASITVELTAVRAHLHVLRGSDPVQGAALSIWRGQGTDVVRTGEDGVASVWLTPGRWYDLRPSKGVFGLEAQRIEIPEDATEHRAWLHLPAALPAAVRVRFEGVTPAPRLAGMLLYDQDDEIKGGGVVRAGDDGSCVLGDLQPGTYRLIVRPDSHFWGGRGHLQPHEQQITLVGGETLDVVADCPLGGRIRVRSRHPDGSPAEGEAQLLDDTGAPLRFHFLRRLPDGALADWRDRVGAPDGLDLVPVLPPGRYTLVVTPDAGGDPVRVEAEVELGQTTEVVVELPRVVEGEGQQGDGDEGEE